MKDNKGRFTKGHKVIGGFKKSVSKLKPLSEAMLGYIAGIIDGEGCITLWWHKKDDNYHPRIRVRMTHKETIYLLQKITVVGTIHTLYPENRRVCYEWCVLTQADVLGLLKELRGYLITKRKSAKYLLMSLYLKQEGIHRGNRMKKLRLLIQKEGKSWNWRDK